MPTRSTGRALVAALHVQLLLVHHRLASRRGVPTSAEAGQTTAEYALVLLGAASVAVLLTTWATGTDAIGDLLDEMVESVVDAVPG